MIESVISFQQRRGSLGDASTNISSQARRLKFGEMPNAGRSVALVHALSLGEVALLCTHVENEKGGEHNAEEEVLLSQGEGEEGQSTLQNAQVSCDVTTEVL